jgi:dTDP-4-dehydrorhamnose 3,5-epimerase
MKIIETNIPDVKIIEPKVFGDERGFFMETWNERAFREAGIVATFVQDNHSRSVKNTLRGLHYQTKHTQGKLVRTVHGEVFDVAVDLRIHSPTFGHWVGVYLSEQNQRMLWIPQGFAHGFFVTSNTADFMYKCTDRYAPEFERTLLWNDNALCIRWPLAAEGNSAIISEKDKNGIDFERAEKFNIGAIS